MGIKSGPGSLGVLATINPRPHDAFKLGDKLIRLPVSQPENKNLLFLQIGNIEGLEKFHNGLHLRRPAIQNNDILPAVGLYLDTGPEEILDQGLTSAGRT
jgi:hypothetical protein